MAEYINRETLLKAVEKMDRLDKESTPYEYNKEGYVLLIKNAPTADVVEVKHGKWIQEWELEKGLEDNDEIPYIKCSLCGHIEWNIDKERNTTPNHCSECGAKMDGGEEE